MLKSAQRKRPLTLPGRWQTSLFTVSVCCAGSLAVHAQVLRIGGFDFNAKARLQGIYSSNVESVRPSTTSESPEDYYIVAGLDLTSVKPIGEGTRLDLSTGIAEEKHFKRSDLDNSRSPFGHFALQSKTEVGRLNLGAKVGYDRTSQSQFDSFSPKGMGKARDPRNVVSYGASAQYDADRLGIGGDYTYRSEQHDLALFKEQNLQETRYSSYISYRIISRFVPRYTYDWTKSFYPDNSLADRIKINERFIFPFEILSDPKWPHLTYAFTWQKEDLGDHHSIVKWRPRHTVTLGDTRQLSKSLSLNYIASYDNYPQPAQDLVQVTYGAALTHRISRSATQTASAQRQPVNTLGSTLKSDQTLYRYAFTKNDLFIYNLTFDAAATYERTIPEGVGLPQTTKRYSTMLTYKQNVSRRLSRSLQYLYSYEDLNTDPEKLEEHRVTLSYEYQF